MSERPRRSSIFDVGFPLQQDRGSSIVNIQPGISENRPQKVLFENTYKMEPDQKLDLTEIKTLMDSCLESHLQNVTYDASRSRSLVNTLSLTIREQVKLLDYKRYKIVCIVNIMEKKSQGARVASRCLWDEKKDNQVDAEFCNTSLICLASVFLIYCE